MRRARLRATWCVVIAVGLALVSWAGLAENMFVGFQRRAADAMFPRGTTDPRVVVVGVDAASVARVGAWPWSRPKQAALVDRLVAAGARVVVLDVVYAPEASGDDVLARSLASTRAVVADAVDVRRGDRWDVAAHAVEPVRTIAAAATVGHSAVTADRTDGIVRSVPLVVEQGRSLVPALSLAALAAYIGVEPVPTIRPNGVQVGRRLVPATGRSQLRVNFAAAPPVRSAADVLDGKTANLRGAVVFVGVTDPTSGDRVLSPIDRGRGLPGVRIHAAAFDTMLQRSFLRPEHRWIDLLAVLALVLVVALAVQFLPVPVAAIGVVALLVGYVLLGVAIGDLGLIVDFVYPPLALALAVPASGAVRYLLDARDRRRLMRLLDQYVPPDVSRLLVSDDRAESLFEGRGLVATVLFCDIRGFTAATSSLRPQEIRRFLDCYYDAVSMTVLEFGGTVLRYVGDEVYAVFGAPLEQEDHAAAADACARAIHAGAPALAETLSGAGLPPVGCGIGISSGELVSAVVGSDLRRQYAVVGSVVSLGARLCALAGRGEIVVSDETFALLRNRDGWRAEAVTLKGFEAPVTVHRLVSPEPAPVGAG